MCRIIKMLSAWPDVNSYINGLDFVAMRCIGQPAQKNVICRNINQTVGIGVIKVMMMLNICVKQTIFIMNGHPPQQASIGKLVQRVIYGTICHLYAGLTDFRAQTLSRHMPVTSIEKQSGNGNTLACRAQSSKPQPVLQQRLITICHLSYPCGWSAAIIFYF